MEFLYYNSQTFTVLTKYPLCPNFKMIPNRLIVLICIRMIKIIYFYRNSILSEWNDFQTQSNEIIYSLSEKTDKVKLFFITYNIYIILCIR